MVVRGRASSGQAVCGVRAVSFWVPLFSEPTAASATARLARAEDRPMGGVSAHSTARSGQGRIARTCTRGRLGTRIARSTRRTTATVLVGKTRLVLLGPRSGRRADTPIARGDGQAGQAGTVALVGMMRLARVATWHASLALRGTGRELMFHGKPEGRAGVRDAAQFHGKHARSRRGSCAGGRGDGAGIAS